MLHDEQLTTAGSVGGQSAAPAVVSAAPADAVPTGLRAGDPLRRCVGVDSTEFFADVWGQRPLLSPGRDPDGFADLFSTAAVDELVSRRGLRTPFLRMARNGSVLPESRFTRPGGSGATVADQVGDDLVLGQLADGATLVLQALHRTWPPLVDFASALAARLGHPVQVNSYVTPAQNQGFSAHYDTHDVFVLQVAGTKRWIIHEPVIEHPLPSQPWDRHKAAVAARAAEEPLIDTVLRPGDALYLPRGYLHAATAQGELSIHLTVGLHPITGFDLVTDLAATLASDAQVRASLPAGVDLGDPAVLANLLRRAAEQLTVAAADPDRLLPDVSARIRRHLNTTTRPAPLRPLASLAAAADLQGRDRVRLRPALRSRTWTAGDGTVSIAALDKTITLPPVMAAAVHELLTGAIYRPDELPGLDPAEQLVLVRRLLREGVLVPVEK